MEINYTYEMEWKRISWILQYIWVLLCDDMYDVRQQHSFIKRMPNGLCCANGWNANGRRQHARHIVMMSSKHFPTFGRRRILARLFLPFVVAVMCHRHRRHRWSCLFDIGYGSGGSNDVLLMQVRQMCGSWHQWDNCWCGWCRRQWWHTTFDIGCCCCFVVSAKCMGTLDSPCRRVCLFCCVVCTTGYRQFVLRGQLPVMVPTFFIGSGWCSKMATTTTIIAACRFATAVLGHQNGCCRRIVFILQRCMRWTAMGIQRVEEA